MYLALQVKAAADFPNQRCGFATRDGLWHEVNWRMLMKLGAVLCDADALGERKP